eukprot:3213103-Pyramimonas_sp.AAC.1
MQAMQLMAATAPTPLAFHAKWSPLQASRMRDSPGTSVILGAVVGNCPWRAPPRQRIVYVLLSGDWSVGCARIAPPHNAEELVASRIAT